jgi:NTE family protein
MVMDQRVQSWLRIHDACRGLSEEEIQLIIESAAVVTPAAGDMIHQAGQPLDALYLVLRGCLKMSMKLRSGVESTIRYVSHGDQFGALGLSSDEAFPVNVNVEDPATLLRFDRETAIGLAAQIPLFRRNLFRMVGAGVKQSVLGGQKIALAKIVTFVCFDEQSRTIVNQVAERLASIGEKMGYLSDLPSGPDNQSVHYKSLLDSDGEFISESEARRTVEQWKDFQRVFVVIDESRPDDRFVRLVDLSDNVFFVTAPANADMAVGDLKKMILASPTRQRKTYFAWVLGEDEQISPSMPELGQLVQHDFKICLSKDGSARLHRQGVERIVHHLRGVKIGVALSGGAARGMTHLGVLKALEEAGITLDLMAGTSAGVLTGIIYCSGYSPDWGIEHFTHDLNPGTFYKLLPMGDALYMAKKYRGHGWDRMLRKYVRDWRLEQFPIPIKTVTTDIVSARSVVRETGDAVNALLESINIPVISVPICRDGMLLVDGGILNNLPADVLVKSECNFIIGVDVSANIEHRVGKNIPETATDKMKAPAAVTTLLRCLDVQAHNMSSLGSQSADVIIAPNVSAFESTAFTKAPEMAEIGYQATMEAVPRIREVLNSIDAELFKS